MDKKIIIVVSSGELDGELTRAQIRAAKLDFLVVETGFVDVSPRGIQLAVAELQDLHPGLDVIIAHTKECKIGRTIEQTPRRSIAELLAPLDHMMLERLEEPKVYKFTAPHRFEEPIRIVKQKPAPFMNTKYDRKKGYRPRNY